MKLNNKGFAVSGVIYALMFLFIILIFATLGLMGSRKIILDKYKQDALKELEGSIELTNTYKIDRSGAAKPELTQSMIPVIYENGNVVKASFLSEYDQNWYNYLEQKWANAVIVKSTSSYDSSPAGTIINQNDILGYYVWIPRYKYKLFNSDYNNHISAPQEIEIVFENKSTPKSLGNLNGEYLTHPAFSFGNVQISGFWFGKFETTGTLDNITVLPNNTPILSHSVKEMYDSTKTLSNLYNIGSADLHMTKNSEWAAVTYLTSSIYGINGEVRKNAYNQSSGFKTGCGSSTTSNAPRTASCEMAFGDASEYPQSTTGNIYGIFDMSGGAWEYVMAVVVDSDNQPRYSESGFTSSNMPDKKYYDIYPTGTNSDISRATIGSATKETWFWYSDRTNLVVNDYPWQFRGGCHNDSDDVGIFSLSSETGKANGSISFRTTLITN